MNSEKFYNVFYPFYSVIDFFLRPYKRILIREVNQYETGIILDVGIGSACHAKWYSSQKIIGIDTSKKMLYLAKKLDLSNLELFLMNGEQTNFNVETIDTVILSHVLSVTDNPKLLMQESQRVLRKGGFIFILNHFTPPNYIKYIDKLFSFISDRLKFRSEFYIEDFGASHGLNLIKEIRLFPFGYFKILIYKKL